ncbi:MAG: hypothetical protein IJF50_03790 [Peptococcaceae bacterium]|nr:hypothetical protein [Peptococcaceae bacterium]
METMALGMFAVSVLILSFVCMYYKKPFIGFVSSIAAMALTCLTGYSWKLMLIDSGKDTTLLGFSRYPAALIILCILLLLAAVSMTFSVILILRKRRNIK